MISTTLILAFCLQTGKMPQKPIEIKSPKISHSQSKRQNHVSPSRHKSGRLMMISSQATCYTVAENGRSTANSERCFSNGPEYLCAMPTNLNPRAIYCRHKSNVCKPIFVLTKTGKLITVHVVDHCPHPGVIDFNPAAANKIFLDKDSSTQDWWSRSSVKWTR